MQLKPAEIKETSPYAKKAKCVFLVKEGIRNEDILLRGQKSCRKFVKKKSLERNFVCGQD